MFEILGVVVIEFKYEEAEKMLIEKITKAFKLEGAFLRESEKVLKNYIELQGRVNALVIDG